MTRKFYMLFYEFLDFKTNLVDFPQKIIGLDVGDKTIGVAISDAMGISATPPALLRTNISKDTSNYEFNSGPSNQKYCSRISN